MQYFCNLNAVNTLAQINIKLSQFIEYTYTLLRKTIFYAVIILSVIASTFAHAMNSDQDESKSSGQRSELKINIPLIRRGSDSQLLAPRDKPRSNSRTLSPTTPANIDSNEISTGKIMLEQSEHLKNALEKRLSSDKLKYDAIENSIDFSHEDSFDSNVSLVLGGERYASYSDYFSHLDNITKEIGEHNKAILEEGNHSMPVFYDANKDNKSAIELITLTKNSGRPTIIRGLATAEKDEDAVSFGLFNEILDTKIEAMQRFTSEVFTQNLNQVNHLSSKLDALFEINDPTQIGWGIPPLSLGRSSHAVGSGATAFGVRALASGAGTTTFGSGSQAARDQASSFGHEAIAKGFNSLALGWQSISDRANTVSVGGPNNLRQITHVQDGQDLTDAVNVKQFRENLAAAEQRIEFSNSTHLQKSHEDWHNKFYSLQKDVDKLIPIDDKLTKLEVYLDKKNKKQEFDSLIVKNKIDELTDFKDENSELLSKIRSLGLTNNNSKRNQDYFLQNKLETSTENHRRPLNIIDHERLENNVIKLMPQERSGVTLRNIARGDLDNDAATMIQLREQSQKFDHYITKDHAKVHAEINKFDEKIDNMGKVVTSINAEVGEVKNKIAQISLDLTGVSNLKSYVNERVDHYVDSLDFEDKISTSPVLSHMSRFNQSPLSSIEAELIKSDPTWKDSGRGSDTPFSASPNNQITSQKTLFTPIKKSAIFERRRKNRGIYFNEGNSSDSSVSTNKKSTSIASRQNTISKKTFNLLVNDVNKLHKMVERLYQLEPPLHTFLESTINGMTHATEITEMLFKNAANFTSESDNISPSLSDSDTDTNAPTIYNSSPNNRPKRKSFSSNLGPIRENSSETLAGMSQTNNDALQLTPVAQEETRIPSNVQNQSAIARIQDQDQDQDQQDHGGTTQAKASTLTSGENLTTMAQGNTCVNNCAVMQTAVVTAGDQAIKGVVTAGNEATNNVLAAGTQATSDVITARNQATRAIATAAEGAETDAISAVVMAGEQIKSDVVTAGTQAASDVATAGEQATNVIDAAVTQATSELATAGEKTIKGVVTAGEQVKSDVVTVATQAASNVATAGEQATNVIDAAVTQATSDLATAGEKTIKGVVTAAEQVKSDVVTVAIQAASDVATASEKAIKSVVTAVEQATNDLFTASSNKATNNVVTVATQATSDVAAAGEQATNDIVVASTQATSDVATASEKAIKSVVTAGEQATNDVVATGTQIASDVAAAGEKTIKGVVTAGEQVKSDVVTVGTQATNDIVVASTQAASDVAAAGEKTIKGVVTAGEQVKSDVVAVGTQATSDVAAAGEQATNDIVVASTQATSNVAIAGEKAIKSVVTATEQATNDVFTAGNEATNNVVATGTQIASDVATAGEKTIKDVVTAGEQVKSDVIAVGTQATSDVAAAGEQATNDIVVASTQATSDVATASEKAIKSVVTAAEQATNDVFTAGNEATNNVVATGTQIASDVATAGEKTIKGIVTAGEQVKSDVVAVGTQATSDVAAAGEQATNDIVVASTQATSDVATAGEKAIKGVVTASEQATNDIVVAGTQATSDVVTARNEATRAIATAAEGAETDAISAIATAAGDIKTGTISAVATAAADIKTETISVVATAAADIKTETIGAIAKATKGINLSHSNAVLYDDDQRNSVTLGGTDSTTPVNFSNVAPGEISEDSTDAVNGAQLFQSTLYSINKSTQYTDQRFSEIGQSVNEMRQGMNDMRQSINNVANHAYSGVAAAMAMPSMGPASPGHTMVSVGTASFKGRKATGVGVTYRSRGGQMIINAAASKAGSDTGMRVQVGYEF